MIRRSLPIAAFTVLLASTPDEGQWLPQQVRAMDWDALRARGMKLTKDEFWHPEKGGVLSAAVQINGCTASFCSPEGLVITNHHCGFGAVNALSTPETNYLRDGFVAADRASELPAPDMAVYVVRRIENVTAQVHAAQAKATTDLERARFTQSAIQKLVNEGEREPNTDCSVSDFFEGREYHRYFRTKLTDVRLVYAPPRSIGEYGGEVDNWEWPRHTGDFCVFRAYAAPDGTPRDHDPGNVPFRPDHYLPVSRDGVQEGDLSIIMGYPGRTERYETSVAIQDRQGIYYPMRRELFGGVIDVLKRASARDEASALKYASTIKSLANVYKNAEGMIWGLARNGVAARKMHEEAAFTAWVEADAERREKYGTVLDDLKKIDLDARKTQQKDLLLGLMLSPRVSPFFAGLVSMAARGGRVGAQAAEARFGAAMDEEIHAVQLPILVQMFMEAAQLPEGQGIPGFERFAQRGDDGAVLKTQDPQAIHAAVTAAIANSTMTKAENRVGLCNGGQEAIEQCDDVLMELARSSLAEARARSLRNQQRSGRQIEVGSRWIEAQEAWRGTSFYPDANSTMRVSIATCKGYAPRDGVHYVPHTTVAGLLAKHTGEEPFNAPPALLAAAKKRSSSRYFDWRIGDVPVCFLTDGDTTGGNSGSPVVNGRGELIGLNFDRVFENVSGDYGWNADRSRNISVDIRYVLWVMEQVQPAHHILDEMGVLAKSGSR